VNKCRLLQLLPFSKSLLSDFQHNSEEFPYLYRQDRSYDKEVITWLFSYRPYINCLGRHQPSVIAWGW